MGAYEACATAFMDEVARLAFTDWDDVEIPIYYPESIKKSKPQPDGTHFRLDRLDVSPELTTVCGGYTGVINTWLLQITLVVKPHVGIENPDVVRDKIVTAFPAASTIEGAAITLKVSGPPVPIQRFDSDGWTKYPVQIPVIYIS